MLALSGQRTRGFTLLELLITMAVVAILAAVAVPSFQNMIATQQVRSAASDLVSALNFARSEAVKRNTTVRVDPGIDPGDDWNDGWEVYVDGSADPIRVHNGLDGVTLTGAPTATAIGFTGDGRRDGGNVNIEIAPPAGSGVGKHCIGVSPTGKPSSDSGAC